MEMLILMDKALILIQLLNRKDNMSKIKRLKVLFLVALLLIISYTALSFFKLNRYKQVSSDICIQGNIDNKDIELVKNYINVLPPILKTKFKKEGWKVCITDNLKKTIVGRTVIEDKIVYIKSGYIAQELMHEFAHIYLHEHPINDDFNEIYKLEGKKLISSYFGTGDDVKYKYSNVTEYYCSAWGVVYLMGGDDKQKTGNRTFTYFSNLFNKLYS